MKSYFVKKIYKALKIDRFIIFALGFFNHKQIDIDIAQARQELNQHSPAPSGLCCANNSIGPYKYDLQIIVPAYNVEMYLKECIDSILAQKTRYSFKITIINDGSTDSTADVADLYKDHPDIEIIHQENRGFSGARNRGLEIISAKYITFVDSDDKLNDGAIEALLSVAEEENADVVQGGFLRLINNSIVRGLSFDSKNQVEAANGLTGHTCGKVFRSEIFKDLIFPKGYWFEDSIFTFLVYSKNCKAFTIPDMIYIYRINPTGITSSAPSSPKSIDTYWITEMLMAEQERRNIKKSVQLHECLMKQIIINYIRTIHRPLNIQKAIFALTSDLLIKHYPEQFVSKEYKSLDRALRNKDWGYYSTFCKYKKI